MKQCIMPHPQGEPTGMLVKETRLSFFRHRICGVCGGSQGIARIAKGPLDHPILTSHVESGAIIVKDEEYLAVVSDEETGTPVVVSIGAVGWEDLAEAYLREHPTPADW